MSEFTVRLTPGRLLLLARRASELASTRGRGGGNSGAYGAYTGGECSEDCWAKSGGLAPFYWGGVDRLAS